MKTLLLPLLLCSCTIHPMAGNKLTGEYVWMGGSLATKTVKEAAFAQTSAGPIGYAIDGKDETLAPKYYFMEKAIGELANQAVQGFKSYEGTRRMLGAQSVRRAGISADRATRLAAIKAEVPAAEIAPTLFKLAPVTP